MEISESHISRQEARKIGFYTGLVGGLLLIFNGLILCILWNWFMPHIFNLPSITVFEAIGLMLVASFLFNASTPKRRNNPHKHNLKNKLQRMVMFNLARAVFALLIGAIAHYAIIK